MRLPIRANQSREAVMKSARTRIRQVLAVTAAAAFVITGAALAASADVVINDIDGTGPAVVDLAYESRTIDAGESTVVTYILRSGEGPLAALNPEPDTNGCNARDDGVETHKVTVVLDTGPYVQATPSTFQFTGCGTTAAGSEVVTFTSSTPGKFDITIGSITGGFNPAGTSAPPDPLYNVETAGWTLTVKATATGFYAPVDMGDTLNVVKGGSTVPLKFEVFATQNEWTNPAVVRDFAVEAVACSAIDPAAVDSVEFTTTGGTSLRYDPDEGQFIQNWKTPSTTGRCYAVTLRLVEDTELVAFFRTR
jgi:hypothetical protein